MSLALPRASLTPPRRVGVGAELVIALLIAMFVATLLGAVPITAADWLAPAAGEPMSGGAHVLWQIRLPRVLLAAAVGAALALALALAGALTQGLFRNPLADPTLLGVTSGALCAAALVLTVFAASAQQLAPQWRLWLLPCAAFAGALAVCFLLDRVARWLTPGSVAGLLLTGIAINAVTMAVVGLCTYLATDEQLRNLSFWTLGSLAGASWPVVALFALVLAAVAGWVRRIARQLNALALGHAAAEHVGMDVSRLRLRLVAVVALLAALAAAWTGQIAFIGLIAPHLVRGIAGGDQRRVLPLAMAAGALLLVVADTVARNIAIAAEVPVGLFTALLGGPVFLSLLRGVARQQKGHA